MNKAHGPDENEGSCGIRQDKRLNQRREKHNVSWSGKSEGRKKRCRKLSLRDMRVIKRHTKGIQFRISNWQ